MKRPISFSIIPISTDLNKQSLRLRMTCCLSNFVGSEMLLMLVVVASERSFLFDEGSGGGSGPQLRSQPWGGRGSVQDFSDHLSMKSDLDDMEYIF